MDGHRFDRLAKSLAAWMSRRRFVAGLAGGAAGGGFGARAGRAQGETPDPEVLAEIVRLSTEALPRLNPELFTNQEFDPVRLPEFVMRLQALATSGTQADAWDGAQLQGFLDTITLIPLAISVGADADVYLDQYAVSVLGSQADPPATPVLPSACITAHRPETCAASCLDVWLPRQQGAAATNDIAFMVEAFFYFLECYLLFGSIESPCLAGLVENGCVPRILCGCAGNCR